MRLITEDNIEQLENLTFSRNINVLLHNNDITPQNIVNQIKRTLMNNRRENRPANAQVGPFKPEMAGLSPDSLPEFQGSPDYPNVSPAYQSPEDELTKMIRNSSDSPPYNPFVSDSPPFNPTTPDFPPPESSPQPQVDFGSDELNTFFRSLPEKSKKDLLALPQKEHRVILRRVMLMQEQKKIDKQKESLLNTINEKSQANQILNVEENKNDADIKNNSQENNEENNANSNNSSEVKKINL
jgi:hypothetical protein